ncbi:MAG TPA: cupin domain-containing protein [Chloroflexaceae bacterium]|mgnify:CR=1 FL=1|nr:cupin domain-containing protein [Chloroflexaceae bacterium]
MSDHEVGEPAARAGMIIALGPGAHLTLKAVGADTGGAFALMEYVLAPGGGAGLHSHSREDESFYVLAGELTVQLGDETAVVTPGELLRIPRGTRHAFVNRGPEPLTALVLLTPAGLEQFFVGLAALTAVAPDGQLDPAVLTALAERHGLDFG